MKHLPKAALCGLIFALARISVAQAEETTATAAPMSLLGTNAPHESRRATVPYRAEMNLPNSTPQGLPALRASAASAGSSQDNNAPAGMRVTYKRAADGSFVKTYVAESGTN